MSRTWRDLIASDRSISKEERLKKSMNQATFSNPRKRNTKQAQTDRRKEMLETVGKVKT